MHFQNNSTIRQKHNVHAFLLSKLAECLSLAVVALGSDRTLTFGSNDGFLVSRLST